MMTHLQSGCCQCWDSMVRTQDCNEGFMVRDELKRASIQVGMESLDSKDQGQHLLL